MFEKFGFTEIVILMVLGLLVFGAKRLPEIGSSMGKGIREFKRSLTDTKDALNAPPEDDRVNRPERILEGQGKAAPTSGEPKRLSQ